jgi:Mn-dependent DtxR family transcriptional regulator
MAATVPAQAPAEHPLALEPSVAAARTELAMRVRALLQERGELDPGELAAELKTTTAQVMFAVRELERLGMVAVDQPSG